MAKRKANKELLTRDEREGVLREACASLAAGNEKLRRVAASLNAEGDLRASGLAATVDRIEAAHRRLKVLDVE